MLQKNLGIVLRQIKYNDNTNIVTIFTRETGKKSFLIYGLNSKKKGKIIRSIIQPLNIVELEFYYKQNQNLSKIKNIAIKIPFKTIYTDFNKKAVLLLISEFLNKVLHENIQDQKLFDFIVNALQLFDLQTENYANFHLAFLTSLTKFLGIEPVNNFSEERLFFNIKEAAFSENFDSTLCFDKKISYTFSILLQTSLADFDKLIINRELRYQMLKALINFYTFHIDTFENINSLEILREIFD